MEGKLAPANCSQSSFTCSSALPGRALSWPWIPHKHHLKELRIPQHSETPLKLPVANKFASLGSVPDEVCRTLPVKEEPKCQVWLPVAPAVPRPRASYNAASLAYLGDCVYELYVRCYFLTPPQSIDKYNNLVMELVCCEAQDKFLKRLLEESLLTSEERDVVRWGKNVHTTHKRATKRAGTAVYCSASALETLIGYLYLSNPGRLEEVMNKLGLDRKNSVGIVKVESTSQA